MIAVRLSNVDAAYRGRRVVRDVTLEISQGEIVGITGPNGSGKTTLLRVIQGVLPISSGFAEVLGVRLGPGSAREVQRRTALVFQTLDVDRRMPISAEEVVLMGRYARLGLLKSPRESDREIVNQSLKRVDAAHLAQRPIGQLSGGERQRVHLARALAQEPDLLLLDEPTTFLDSQSQCRIKEVIRSVHRQSELTTVVVSHDASVLADLCDRIIVMTCGELQATVSPEELAHA